METKQAYEDRDYAVIDYPFITLEELKLIQEPTLDGDRQQVIFPVKHNEWVIELFMNKHRMR